jgi:uroporphyrinogen decarboxylase
VLTALRHQEPDRVPLFYRDVPEVQERLLEDLALPDREALLQFFDIDFRWVEPPYVGPPLEDQETGRRRSIWGVAYGYVPFSESAGYWQALSHPLADCTDPGALDDYPWPCLEGFDFSTLEDQVSAYDGYAIMTGPGHASPGLLQSPIQALVGPEKSLTDMMLNPALFDALVERTLDFVLPFVDRMLQAASGRIDFLRIGDDFGTQNGLLIGPQPWRRSIQPALKAAAGIAKKHGAYYYHHSCGSVRELIPDLIETGVDVLDPVQVTAAGMVPSELKAAFGDRLCFSGGVDEQGLLRTGTPGDVKAGVHQLLEDMARGGGFFIGPTHNFQDDIPTQNIVAMYEAARDWRY